MTVLKDEFERGRRRGLDPRNDRIDGPARTTYDSVWWDDICLRCGHTFREGDTVQVESSPGSPSGLTVTHSMDLPPCTAIGQESAIDPQVREAFYEAVAQAENADPEGTDGPRSIATPQRLPLEHPLVLARSTCLFCGTTIRAYEAIVICPCSLDRNPCRSVIHHDPAAGLACFDLAFPDGYPERCPTFFTKVRPPWSDRSERPGDLARRLSATRRRSVSAVIVQLPQGRPPDG